MRLLLLTAIVASFAVLAACGASSPVSRSSATLPPELAAAITRTMAATSIEATSTESSSIGTTTPGQGLGSQHLTYQAPDRLEIEAGSRLILIGTTTYASLSSSFLNPSGGPSVSVVGRPPTGWIETTQPKQTAATIQARVFGPLTFVQRARSVSGRGPTYSFRYHDKTAHGTVDATGTVQVADGRVASIVVDSTTTTVTEAIPGGGTVPPTQQDTQRITYSQYDSAPTVNPPPSSEVTVVPFNNGGGPPSSVAVAPVHLPKPTVTARSPMQFRPVQSTSATPCPATSTTDPPAGQPATLPAVAGGTCYDLAPAALTITSVANIEVMNDEVGQPAINLTFEPADGAAFDTQIGAMYYQHQVAIVMFGRVLEAPTISATQFDGQATIEGLDPQTEANVVAALTG